MGRIIDEVIEAQNEYWCQTQRSKGAVLIVDRTVYAELQAACTPANRAGGVRDEGGRLIKVSGLHICVDFAAQEKTLRIASLPSEDWFEGVLPDICALSSGPDWGEEPEREVVLGVVETKEMLRVLFGRIRQGLENGDRTELRGFGVFEVVLRKERVARNPHTGEKVNVPAKKRVVFRVGRQLKTMVLDS
jgi:nucleoid DNA-binding protein